MLVVRVAFPMNWLKNSLSNRRRLGPLEAHLLGMLSQRKNATVRELLAENTVDAAYTTVMTTLDRLYKKGFLDRAPDGQRRAYRYRLIKSEREFYQAVLGTDLDCLLSSATNPVTPVSFLVDVVTERDARLLDELRRAVNRKRQQLRRKGEP